MPRAAKKKAKSSASRQEQSVETGSREIESFILSVLRESYLEQTKILQDYAQKVQYFNALKKRIREELSRIRKQRAGLEPCSPDDEPIDPVPITCFDTFAAFESNGTPNIRTKEVGVAKTKLELETYIEELEYQVSTVSDDSQLANIDLQNSLQKQQQTLQMMSNVSKSLHDTAMAIIRKIGS